MTSSPAKRSLKTPTSPLLRSSSSALPLDVSEALNTVPILAANNPYNRLITAIEIVEEKNNSASQDPAWKSILFILERIKLIFEFIWKLDLWSIGTSPWITNANRSIWFDIWIW